MELLLGAMIVALWVKTIPGVIADAVTTLRASKAGQWDTIDKERERKDKRSAGRREAMSKAWQGVRSARNKKAGGTGQYRPGVGAYLSDVYHGLCEDGLEKRKVKRAARPPLGPNGKRPVAVRLDDAFEARVDKQRQQTGYAGRIKQAGRLLIDPVGENRRSDAVMPPPASPPPAPAPTLDGPRTACPVCGDTLTERDGGWSHPQGSTCALGYPLEERDADAPTLVPPAKVGAPNTARLGQATAGTTTPTVADRMAAEDATRRKQHGVCSRCGDEPNLPGRIVGPACAHILDQLGNAAEAEWARLDPDRAGDPRRVGRAVFDALAANNTHGWTAPEIKEAVGYVKRRTNGTETSNGGTTMNTATGDVHDVETCKNECEALADDLVRVDTSLDVIDEAIRSAQSTVEHINAWLTSKNADACVPGMAAALDALSADRIKELIDTVAIAKQGVQDTIDNLAPLEEANELVGNTDGSALNGR